MPNKESFQLAYITPSPNENLILLRLLIALMILLVVSACSSQAEDEQISNDLVATAVAATVSAQPKETPEPSSVSLETPVEVEDVVEAVVEISDPQSYPNAEELENVNQFWDLLTPPCFSFDLEDVVAHRVWRLEDLPEKILNYYDEMAYKENWEPDSRYISCDGPWQYRSFSRGDDIMRFAILGNLSSADIAQFPDIGLKTADSLILMAVGNPIKGMLSRGQELLEEGSVKEAQSFAERVLSERTSAGAGSEDAYIQEATALLTEAANKMSPLSIAQEWLENAVEADIFGEGRFEELMRMRMLGLVREYGSESAPIIDSYAPIGEWVEISNDGSTAVTEFVGKAVAASTNRTASNIEVQEFDYAIRITLSRGTYGTWDINYPTSLTLLTSYTTLQPELEETILAQPTIDESDVATLREEITLVLENIKTFRTTSDGTNNKDGLCLTHEGGEYSPTSFQAGIVTNCQSGVGVLGFVQADNQICINFSGKWDCTVIDEEDQKANLENSHHPWGWYGHLDPARFKEQYVLNLERTDIEILNYRYLEGSLGGQDCHLFYIEYSHGSGKGKQTMCYDRSTYYPVLMVSMDETQVESGSWIRSEKETRYFDFNEPIEISLPGE